MSEELHRAGIENIKRQALFRMGKEREAYLLGLREGIHVCCYITGVGSKLDTDPSLVELTQFVEDHIDKSVKDEREDRTM